MDISASSRLEQSRKRLARQKKKVCLVRIDSRGGLSHIVSRWYVIAPPGGTLSLRRLHFLYSALVSCFFFSAMFCYSFFIPSTLSVFFDSAIIFVISDFNAKRIEQRFEVCYATNGKPYSPNDTHDQKRPGEYLPELQPAF